MTRYVQAWEVNDPDGFSGYVYDQKIALDKFGSGGPGTELDSVTIVRHDNGDREYLRGTVAADVEQYRR